MGRGILIVYYSHSANTQKIAKFIQQKTEGILHEIQPEIAYPVSYNAVLEQAKKEIQANYRPALKTKIENIESYDTVFIGTPNWCSTFAPPIATFLESYDLSGKTVIPFCTHGGGGFGRIEREIAKLCSNATVLPGLDIYGSGGGSAESQMSAWLQKIGVLKNICEDRFPLYRIVCIYGFLRALKALRCINAVIYKIKMEELKWVSKCMYLRGFCLGRAS